MGRVRVGIEIPGPVSEAEALWYDHTRWSSFVDGFGHVHRIDDAWPGAGAEVIWDSPPGGRGRVREQVERYEPRVGPDAERRGRPAPRDAARRVRARPRTAAASALELEYAIKDRNLFTPLVDLVFVRRALGESLRRTLRRFATELAAERELAGLQ